jgi:restriction system protein
MLFIEAAYEILKSEGTALHYKEITTQALGKGILVSEGRNPEQTMGAKLYVDTLKPESRFKRGDVKGTFTLNVEREVGIQSQIKEINTRLRKDLRKHLHNISPEKFEELIRLLLVEMGFTETVTTPFRNDQGVDVRGVLHTNSLTTIKVAIQAKRWVNNVGAPIVRNLRGSLNAAEGEQGLIITPGNFSSGAKQEAQISGRTPISLINGNQLVDLLIQYKLGIKTEEYLVPSIDTDYWTEVLGIDLVNKGTAHTQQATLEIVFPMPIQGKHKDQVFQAELLDISGRIRLGDQEYQKPSIAAKVVVTDWKGINGWDFWKYINPKSGKLEKIGKLRPK